MVKVMISQQRINHQQLQITRIIMLLNLKKRLLLPGRKSGSLVGISQIDSSHLTEREKRVIKREHVEEAQKLVDNYKDITHSYRDRLNAQQKVNTLSEGHQKRFNKQINKVYNGK